MRKIALVEMDPPKAKLIFLSRPLIKDLNEVLLQIENDDRVNVVILTGRLGSPSFATGANINELDV